ncbi:MAG TPA: peptidoglycan-binding protein [Trichocoleus sp.]|jgi:predicted chitinase
MPLNISRHNNSHDPQAPPTVRDVQTALQHKDIEVAVDGIFGPQTEAAVEAFQAKSHLTVDGIVGPHTWNALQAHNSPPHPGSISAPLVKKLVNVVPADIQSYAHRSIPLILHECDANQVTLREQIAYILATAQHESLLGKYLTELSSGKQYEGRKDLGNTQPGDGVRFKGRGYVQITGRRNYTDWSKRLQINLTGNPKQAAEPAIAAKVLVRGMQLGTFTGKKLSDYLNSSKRDFVNARRIVNGLDKADVIAGYAKAFFSVLV